MKTLLLLCAITTGLHAQTWSVDPVVISKAIFRRTSGTTKARRISEAILIGFNYADYRTTIIGTGRGFCETNPQFSLDGCRLNRPKFTYAKLAVTAFAASQEISPLWRRHREGWNRVFLISNITLTIPLARGVVGNTRLLLRD